MNPVEPASPTFVRQALPDYEVAQRLETAIKRIEMLPSRLNQTAQWAGMVLSVTSTRGETLDAMDLLKRTTHQVWCVTEHYKTYRSLGTSQKIRLLECEKELETIAAFVNEPADY